MQLPSTAKSRAAPPRATPTEMPAEIVRVPVDRETVTVVPVGTREDAVEVIEGSGDVDAGGELGEGKTSYASNAI